MLVSLQQIGVSFGATPILTDITAEIDDHSRIGLIGANGAGKTTLLNVICGTLDYETGTLDRKNGLVIGYLKQNTALMSEATILAEMESVFSELLDARRELDDLRLEMADVREDSPEYRALAARYDERLAFFESNEGYLIDVKIQTVLNGMGFGDRDLQTKISTLSGGEKTRLALCKLLLREPELLILDEPTNHLDFKTLRWLEGHLKEYKGAIVVVSHDRYFLDETAKEIWEVEFQGLRTFPGNYTKYKLLKAELMERWRKEYEQQQEEIADLEDYVARNLVRASTSKSAKSRIKKLERMERIDRPREYAKRIALQFSLDRDPVKEVLKIENAALSVGEGVERKRLFAGLDLTVERGQKIAIIGENGVGKSSLLKAVLGKLPLDSGRYRWGQETKISFFEQENRQLNPNNTVLEELWSRHPRKNEVEIRSMLGRVLLSGEDVYKQVRVLSGGERAKLAFAILMMERGNVLILDEPTNHLDLWSKELLEEALMDYRGTLIFVSHDRYLLQRVPDRIIELFPDRIEIFPGNYDYYREKTEQQAIAAAKAPQPEKEKKQNSSGYRTKEDRAREAKARARLRELEQQIESLEDEIAAIEAELASPNAFAGDYQKMQEACITLEERKKELSDRMDEWEQLA